MKDSESTDDEPQKEPRQTTTIVQYVTTSSTGQFQKMHPRLKARLVADGRDVDLPRYKSEDRKPSQIQELGER